MDVTHAALPGRTEPADPQPLDPPDLRPRRPPAGLHQPLRILIAIGEAVLAVVLGAAAVWAWRRGAIPYELPANDNPAIPDTVQRWAGPWIGAAFGLAAVAGVLVLDAVRQVMLAVRGRWRATATDAGELDESDQSDHGNHSEQGDHSEHSDLDGTGADRHG